MCTKNDKLLIKLLSTYTLPKLYGLEMVDPLIYPKFEQRYNYILSVALHRNVEEVLVFLKDHPQYSLKNVLQKANLRYKQI